MSRLLLVEDAPDVALVVERLGRRMGLEVAHRPDVASAWDHVRDAPPDLILLDLNLIGDRGEALCRLVRAHPETARLPVALFSHWDRPGDIVSGIAAGADYVVSKELLARPEAWQARVQEILAAGAGPGEAVSIGCQWNSLLPQRLPEGVRALNDAMRHRALGPLRADVLRLVLRRAADRAAGGRGAGETWLRADGLALDPAHAVSPRALALFAASVAEQLERLLGAEDAAPVVEAMRAPAGGNDE